MDAGGLVSAKARMQTSFFPTSVRCSDEVKSADSCVISCNYIQEMLITFLVSLHYPIRVKRVGVFLVFLSLANKKNSLPKGTVVCPQILIHSLLVHSTVDERPPGFTLVAWWRLNKCLRKKWWRNGSMWSHDLFSTQAVVKGQKTERLPLVNLLWPKLQHYSKPWLFWKCYEALARYYLQPEI